MRTASLWQVRQLVHPQRGRPLAPLPALAGANSRPCTRKPVMRPRPVVAALLPAARVTWAPRRPADADQGVAVTYRLTGASQQQGAQKLQGDLGRQEPRAAGLLSLPDAKRRPSLR